MNKKIAIAIVCFLAVFALLIYLFSHMKYTYTVSVGGKSYVVEVADTSYLQEKGLSGHAPLHDDQGMLFIFSKADTYGFWMKDMLFPLDIIWIDQSLHVVHVEKGLSPETYPKVYYPEKPALYVLEISSGESDRTGIKIGDSVKISKKKL